MDFKQILINRRAINFFDPDTDINDALLQEIIEDAAKSPSSFNLQPWKLVVFRAPDKKAALRKLAFDQPKVTEAPVVLMLLADRDGWKEGCPTLENHFSNTMEPEQRDWFIGTTSALYGTSRESSQAFANKNAGLFAMSLMYSATHHGLHTHPMDGFDHEGVRKEFDIPDNYWIPMLIALGHPKKGLEIKAKAWRQSYEEMVLKTY